MTRDTKTRDRRKLTVDDESRALMANREFREAIEEGRASADSCLLSLEEVEAELGITADEKAAASEWLDRLEAEETNSSGR